MDIVNGGMKYEIGFDYNALLKGAKQVLAALGDVDAAMSAFGKIDDWTKVTKEAITEQKRYIKELEKGYRELKAAVTNANSVAEHDKLAEELKEQAELIDEAKQGLADMEAASKAFALSQSDLTKQLHDTKQAMQELAAAGLEDTEEYKKLSDEATKLGKQLKNLDRSLKQSLDPMRAFQVASSLKEVARSIEQIGKASDSTTLKDTGDLINMIADGVQGYLQGGWWGGSYCGHR